MSMWGIPKMFGAYECVPHLKNKSEIDMIIIMSGPDDNMPKEAIDYLGRTYDEWINCKKPKLLTVDSLTEKAIKQAVVAFRDFVDCRGVCHDELHYFEKFIRENIYYGD